MNEWRKERMIQWLDLAGYMYYVPICIAVHIIWICLCWFLISSAPAISNNVDCTVATISIVSTFKCISGVGSYYQTDKQTSVGDKYRQSPILPHRQMDGRLRLIRRKPAVCRHIHNSSYSVPQVLSCKRQQSDGRLRLIRRKAAVWQTHTQL